MTWNCADPRANPLNTRRDGNFDLFSQEIGARSYFSRTQDPSKLTVPVQKMFSPEDLPGRNSSLQVPHQNQIPMGMENDITFLQKDRFLRLSDGTVVDLETRKIVRQVQDSRGCWGDGTIRWEGENGDQEWGDPMDWSPPRENCGCEGLSREDIEYARISKIMNGKTEASMSDEQKELLANLDKIIGKPKLVEEK